MSSIKGIYAASMSIFKEDYSLNLEQTTKHAENLINKGCHGVAMLGSTGQAQLISVKEKIELIEHLDRQSINKIISESFRVLKKNGQLYIFGKQPMLSEIYHILKEKFDFMTNQNNNYIQDLPLKISDFFIVVFNNDLDNEYMLLYKNFSTRILASDYCLKYLNFLQKCLIVNTQNLN